jgi:hypothetical protein
MKTVIVIILSFFLIQVWAPPAGKHITKEQSYQFTLLTNPNYRTYYQLIKAVVHVESKGNDSAYNAKEGAVGAFQIRQCRVDHFNRLQGTNYILEDFYNYDLSLECFLFFAQGKSFEKAAKSWNGSGKLTIIYWDKVQSQLAQL